MRKRAGNCVIFRVTTPSVKENKHMLVQLRTTQLMSDEYEEAETPAIPQEENPGY